MIDKLNHYFHYDREQGKLIWKNHHCQVRSKFIGKEAGSLKKSHNKIYRRIKLEDKNYYTHALIYYLETGIYNNKLHIDHIDGNSLNNKFSNLRMVTLRSNHRNRDRHLSGEKLAGTHQRKDTGRWSTKIYKDGKEHHFGCYDTEEEAHNVYMRELNKHLQNGGK